MFARGLFASREEFRQITFAALHLNECVSILTPRAEVLNEVVIPPHTQGALDPELQSRGPHLFDCVNLLVYFVPTLENCSLVSLADHSQLLEIFL